MFGWEIENALYLCRNENLFVMKKAIWISYDLGIGGDYDGLYRWLANHKAVECGDGLAFFNYVPKNIESLLEELKGEIEDCVRVNNKTRIYCIRKEGDSMKGTFLFGARKGNPWEGYGDVDNQVEDGE